MIVLSSLFVIVITDERIVFSHWLSSTTTAACACDVRQPASFDG